MVAVGTLLHAATPFHPGPTDDFISQGKNTVKPMMYLTSVSRHATETRNSQSCESCWVLLGAVQMLQARQLQTFGFMRTSEIRTGLNPRYA